MWTAVKVLLTGLFWDLWVIAKRKLAPGLEKLTILGLDVSNSNHDSRPVELVFECFNNLL